MISQQFQTSFVEHSTRQQRIDNGIVAQRVFKVGKGWRIVQRVNGLAVDIVVVPLGEGQMSCYGQPVPMDVKVGGAVEL